MPKRYAEIDNARSDRSLVKRKAQVPTKRLAIMNANTSVSQDSSSFLRPKRPRRCRIGLFSLMPGVSLSFQAFLLPRFLPLRTSRREAQQQHWPNMINHAIMLVAAATHMNANICTPKDASMSRVFWLVITFFMTTPSTVPMTVATVVHRAPKKTKKRIGAVPQRVKTLRGMRKIIRKFRQAPVRKSPNIQCETVRIKDRMLLICAGRATGEKNVSILAKMALT